MAKNDPPSSTVAYITLITRVFWPFLGGVIIFMKNMTMLHFSWKFHFHEKWDGRWNSSHVEGPASTARFTGGQVIGTNSETKWMIKTMKNLFSKTKTASSLFLSFIYTKPRLLKFSLTCPPVKRSVEAGPSTWDENHLPSLFWWKWNFHQKRHPPILS